MLDEVKENNYQKLKEHLIKREIKIGTKEDDIEFDIQDAYIVTRELFDWKCIVTEKNYSGVELVRWDPEKKLDVRNAVLMTTEAMKKHMTYDNIQGKYPLEVYQRFKEAQERLEIILQKREPVYAH
jgi:hypothetical protein